MKSKQDSLAERSKAPDSSSGGAIRVGSNPTAVKLFFSPTAELCSFKKEVLGGFEPPSLDSESRVLTVTPQDLRCFEKYFHHNTPIFLRNGKKSPVGKILSNPGFEPGLPRPQRGVLTARRIRQLDQR